MSSAHMTLPIIGLLAFITIVAGHGSMTTPRGRGTVKTNSLTVPDLGLPASVPSDGCPHCLNGGGTGTVAKAMNGNWRPYLPMKGGNIREDAGPCGDKILDPTPRDHESRGKYGPPPSFPVSATYKPGQTVTFEIDVTTNHNGFFEFFLCDVSQCGGDPTPDCFRNGHCRQLNRAPVPACENQQSKDCAPTDPAFPGRFYVPCRVGGHVGEHFMKMRYKLPAGFTCQKCVVQWYWATANSCNPPGFKEFFEKFPMNIWGRCPGDGGAFGARNPQLAPCGGAKAPEEFWQCTDVRVTNGGGGGGGANNGGNSNNNIPPPPIKTPTPASPPANDGTCSANWKKCGGINHTGPTRCCDSTFMCMEKNRYYHQCVKA